MSITISAVFSGRRSPLYGHGYGSAATNRPVLLLASGMFWFLEKPLPRHTQLTRRASEIAPRRASRDHDRERQHVRRRAEQIIPSGDTHRLQRRAERTGTAEQQRRVEAIQRLPAREDDQRHCHQPLSAG